MMINPWMLLNLNAAFRFVVAIDNVPVGAFTECTLPVLEWDVEEVKEGGLNTYVHQLPGRRKSAKITLKNGIGVTNLLLAWYTQSLHESISRRRVTISLLNSLHIPVMIWNIEQAWPVKWTGPQLKTDENTVAIQTFELTCGEITIV
jgi:phage tail-like protein